MLVLLLKFGCGSVQNLFLRFCGYPNIPLSDCHRRMHQNRLEQNQIVVRGLIHLARKPLSCAMGRNGVINAQMHTGIAYLLLYVPDATIDDFLFSPNLIIEAIIGDFLIN